LPVSSFFPAQSRRHNPRKCSAGPFIVIFFLSGGVWKDEKNIYFF
jgi:hypothetical protein